MRNAAASADVIALRPHACQHAPVSTIPAGQVIFRQGERCEAVFHIRAGIAKVHILSKSGREAVILIIGPGDFFGEGCLLEHARRVATVTAMTECTTERITVAETWRRLHSDPVFAKKFMDFLVMRNRRYIIDLSDHHFNSTEQRLARALLQLPNVYRGTAPSTRPPRISQEMLAEMVGTTRSRVNFFMNKFRRLGMIEYSGKVDGNVVVHSSLATILRGE